MGRISMQCDRCGAGPAGADRFDQCDLCGQTLCDECMAAGCCGQAPAISRRRPYEARGPVSPLERASTPPEPE